MSKFIDYYKLLGISPEASIHEIKSAYRALAKKHHPDLGGANPHIFMQIKAAYEVLSDLEQRNKYDIEYFSKSQQSPPIEGTLKKGDNLLYHLNISISESLTGCHKTIKYIQIRAGLRTTKTLDIKIPPNIQDQQKLRVRGVGDSLAREQAPGDLLIAIHITATDSEWCDGADIHIKKVYSVFDLVIENIISIEFAGQILKFKKPLQLSATTLTQCFAGKGLSFSKDPKLKGDLYVHFIIEVPHNLDKIHKDKLQSLKKDL